MMKSLLLSIVLAVCLAASANAHQGMLALFADTNNHECYTALGVGQIGNLYLMYVRGDGPRMGPAYEFKLLRSTSGAVFLFPTWPSEITLTLGTVEGGLSLTAASCFPDLDYVPLGTIPIMNISDPDTFTVKVVLDPGQVPQHVIAILKCDPVRTLYAVPGGMFVFNAGCNSPLDPFAVVATKPTTWGAVKDLYR
jgi:hypothetical protein